MNMGELRQQLVSEGLVEPLQAEGWSLPERGSAWYISLLVGLGAWIAAILLMFVMGIIGILEEEESAFMMGMLGMAAAVLIRRRAQAEFLQQLMLASLLACQGLALWGMPRPDDVLTWGLMAEALLFLPLAFFADRPGRIVTALVMGGVLLGVAFAERHGLIPLEVWGLGLALLAGFCWLRQRALLAGRMAELQAPLGYASVITLFGLLQFSYWDFFYQRHLDVTMTVLLMAAVLWMVARLQSELKLPMGAGLVSLGAVLVLGLVTLNVPGVMAGVGTLVLGFAARNAVLQGLAWIYLVTFGTTFYYELSLTLLEKSGVLVLSGALFLALGWLVRRSRA